MEIHMMNRTFVNVGGTGLVVAAAMSFATLAQAGECPADKLVADGEGQKAGATTPKDVTDTVLASIDLSKEMVKLDSHLFRMRRLEIKPGGIVPWHSHADRPALIYVVQVRSPNMRASAKSRSCTRQAMCRSMQVARTGGRIPARGPSS
jgi:hypothetical protein